MKSILVEDEIASQVTLKTLLESFCPNVTVLGAASNIKDAKALIEETAPDLVFLDIELQGENGFELLTSYEKVPFHVIFTTAYDQYAVRAFKYAAVDYLLKPVDVEELKASVAKAANTSRYTQKQHFKMLMDNYKNKPSKIALPNGSGFTFVDVDEIVRLEADDNYTTVHFQNNDKLVISKTLKFFEDLLEGTGFFRINRKDLVNLQYIQSYSRQKKARVVLPGNLWLELSDARKDAFLDLFQIRG